MKVVHVQWRDAASMSGWRSRKAVKDLIKHDLTLCETVGFVISDSKDKVVICHTKGEEEYSGLFEIPKRCIEKIKVITDLPGKLKL